VIRHIGDDKGIGIAEGEVEGAACSAAAPPLAAATLEKAFGTCAV